MASLTVLHIYRAGIHGETYLVMGGILRRPYLDGVTRINPDIGSFSMCWVRRW